MYLGALKGADEKYFSEFAPRSGVSTEVSPRGMGEKIGLYVPEKGLFNYLTMGRRKTDTPQFGAVAIFFSDSAKVMHSGLVLGRDRSGMPYLLQKINDSRPIMITTEKYGEFEGWRVDYFQ